MNRLQAIGSIEVGMQITHSSFHEDEWVTVHQVGSAAIYRQHDGLLLTSAHFWIYKKDSNAFALGWKIWEEPKEKKAFNTSDLNLTFRKDKSLRLAQKRFRNSKDYYMCTIINGEDTDWFMTREQVEQLHNHCAGLLSKVNRK
ncbi:hypothetical protein GD1_223 [Paraglaciecola Antarctic GD virus 1]|nr:hypothetical protein GD1_223 [Paraglaciecola Antarctic GD virus 1]